MKRTRRTFSREYNLAAVKKVIKQGLTYCEVARALGIGDANIRKDKGMATADPVAHVQTIDLKGPFTQWDAVTSIYREHALDTLPLDHAGCGDFHYRNQTGRNDFRILKVTHDRENFSFYAETGADISPATVANWMWLLIDVKGQDSPNCEGFHYLVNR
jgi:hypothetical protein